MKKPIFFFVFALVVSCQLLVVSCFADYVPGEVVVKFKSPIITLPEGYTEAASREAGVKSASVNKSLNKFKIKKFERLFANLPKQAVNFRTRKTTALPDASNIYLLSFPEETDVNEIVTELKNNPDVVFAHPNYIARKFSTTPNDPSYSSQWGMAKINMPAVWDSVRGDSSSIAAVVDSGIDYNHPDLSGKIILGRDYVNLDNDPMDDDGHGTHVAGVIGAITNNGVGVAGVNWNTRIMAVKVLDSMGFGSYTNVEKGIEYAANNGASVINLSLGDTAEAYDLQVAVDAAAAKGCIIVAAAGNENQSTKTYPAAYSNVIAVAATDSSDLRSVWSLSQASNYGTWVDIAAPGTLIYSTYLNNTYKNESGTSMAAPFVSGVVGLLLSMKPNYTFSQVLSRLQSAAVNIDALNPGYAGLLGAGRLSADSVIPPIASITSPATGEVCGGTFTISGTARAVNFSKYTVSIGAGASPSSYTAINTGSAEVIGNTLSSYTSTATGDGTYTLKLAVENSDPETSEALTAIIIDNSPPIAAITFPSNGATLTDPVTIRGTAADGNLYYYNLEYSSDAVNFIKIGTRGSAVSSGDLGYWNTSGLNGTYILRVSVFDKAGNSSSESISLNISDPLTSGKTSSGLSYCSPNPFNPSLQNQTYISYNLSGNFNTAVYLFDLTGKLIFKRNFAAGENGGKAGQNLVAWDGKNSFAENVANGVYLFKVTSDQKVITSGKIIVLY